VGFKGMSQSAVAIPEKLFFKIGEVCELAGVQAHVLRYWESEFAMLAPQKNRAGQRVYRKRDVEIALRIRELLYEDQYTIAGAKKRLANDLRAGTKLRVVEPGSPPADANAPEDTGQLPFQQQSDDEPGAPVFAASDEGGNSPTAEQRLAWRRFASDLREILELLEAQTKASASRTK
jgi:DNA-binding transcriptional MerR regulator